MKTEISCSIGLGNIIAGILSWSANHSFWWLVLHSFLGWYYIIYYIFIK